MKKTVLTTIIFFTFFSGSPKNINQTNMPILIYEPEESELIIKLKDLNSVLDSANMILNETSN